MPSLNHPTSGTADPTDLTDNDDAIRTVVNGQIDADNLAANAVTTAKITDSNVTTAKIADANVTAAKLADAAKLGLDDGTNVRRGKCIIATEESTASTSYTTLATPDTVSSVVLPTDGLIFVLYRAMWKHSIQDDGRAAIFLGSNQLKVQVGGSDRGPVTQAAVSSTGAYYTPVVSSPHGLLSPNSGAAYSSDITTGQSIALAIDGNTAGDGIDTELNGSKRALGDSSAYLLSGGVCAIHAAAGTYTVTVQYKTVGAGTVYAKERKLWVWTQGF